MLSRSPSTAARALPASALNRASTVQEAAGSQAAQFSSPQPVARSSESGSSYFTAGSIESPDASSTDGSYKTATGEPADLNARASSPSPSGDAPFGQGSAVAPVAERPVDTSRMILSWQDSIADAAGTRATLPGSGPSWPGIDAGRPFPELRFQRSVSHSSLDSVYSGDSAGAVSHLSDESQQRFTGDHRAALEIDRASSSSDVDRISAVATATRSDRLERVLHFVTRPFFGKSTYGHRGIGKKADALGRRENPGQFSDSPPARFNTRGGGKLVRKAFLDGGLAGGLNELYRQAKINWAKGGPSGALSSHGYPPIERSASDRPAPLSGDDNIASEAVGSQSASSVASQIEGNRNPPVSRDSDAPRGSEEIDNRNERAEQNRTDPAMDSDTVEFGDLSLKVWDDLERQASIENSEERDSRTASPFPPAQPQSRPASQPVLSPARNIEETIRTNLTTAYLQRYEIESETDLESHIKDQQMLAQAIADSSLLQSIYTSSTGPIRSDHPDA